MSRRCVYSVFLFFTLLGFVPPGAARADSVCGNGLIEVGEDCDDDNVSSGDGCQSDCEVQSGWNCSGQPSNCTAKIACGNGVKDAGEQCDDGNLTSGDGCQSTCAVQAGWTCAGSPSVCTDDQSCGNGVVEAGEQCDDGDNSSGDGCQSDCTVQGGWSCSGSPSLCRLEAQCGNGTKEAGEQCDDGNVSSGDGCQSGCTVQSGWTCTGSPSVCTQEALCGNGLKEVGEQCDDGDVTSGDGCQSGCTIQSGWTCTGQPSVCQPKAVCGNGLKEIGEQCDDGDVTSGDGCQSSCTIQSGWSCTGSPSVCIADGTGTCGNSVKESGEQCDDGDRTSGDGCQSDCTIQSGWQCSGSPSVCVAELPTGDCGNGVVDAGEDCDGGPCCDEDCQIEDAGTVCRAPAGACDKREVCDGSSSSCPADAFAPSTKVCRAAVSAQCDVAETCSGTSKACPADVLAGCPDVDGTDCVHPACDASGNCTTQDDCVEICRDSAFWATRGTRSDNETLLDMVIEDIGPLEVCGERITKDTELGELDSAVEALCVKTRGFKERELFRQLVTTQLNCAVSEGGDCDDILSRFTEVSLSACNALCERGASGPAVQKCIDQLECFNEGGTVLDGDCALGTCEGYPDELCGAAHGGCADASVCEPFADSCASQRLCTTELATEAAICPRRFRPLDESKAACTKARENSCTIDDCD
jgi:cysteine-rich repeat protein